MGFKKAGQNYDKITGLAKNPKKNKGIAKNKKIESEKQLQKFFSEWLKNRHLYRAGIKRESKYTKDRDKKENAKITQVQKEPHRGNGFGDIAIHHDGLDLSWNHNLANPLILELKHPDEFRKATHQAVMYKSDSESRFLEEDERKICQTAIATTKSLSTAEIATASSPQKHFSADYDCKRIYWNLKVGVTQSIHPEKVIISFGEADKVLIK